MDAMLTVEPYLSNQDQVSSAARELSETIVQEHVSMLLSYLTALLGSRIVAEDIVQDVFVNVIQKLDSYDASKGSFPVWIRTIGRNLAFNAMRSKKHEVLIDAPEIEGIEDVFAAFDRERAEETWDERIQVLRQCMTNLSDPMSDTCRMFYFNKQKTADIAVALQVSQALILKRLERARGCLRVCIESKLVKGFAHA